MGWWIVDFPTLSKLSFPQSAMQQALCPEDARTNSFSTLQVLSGLKIHKNPKGAEIIAA